MHRRARAHRLSILRAVTLPSFILLRAVSLFMLELDSDPKKGRKVSTAHAVTRSRIFIAYML